ncbi:MAG TPA: DUF2752 domain-containing protein [Tepidisphaeraceae bacterium]
MDQAAPLIYRGAMSRQILPTIQRLIALGVALSCLGTLVLASQLHPSPDGYGTHTQIGLQHCAFFERTGLPCPSCGMTTSWSWFARGNVLASLYIQPMGTLLALAACWCVWIGFYVAITGRPVYRLLRVVPGRYYSVPLVALAIMAWGWKIYIHLAGRDGWL